MISRMFTAQFWDKLLSFSCLDLAKWLVSALIIVAVNKVQLFNDRLSALLIALPLTSLLAMIWMHQSGQSSER
jgi:Cu/Ag efflux pump CusA